VPTFSKDASRVTIGSRHATPYHAPLYLAQAKGYFKEQGIKVALLEPNDPSVSLTAAFCRKPGTNAH
jgi:ABC-type nitrate/sulfonate/bicarbonate transport system substrate-binding protein